MRLSNVADGVDGTDAVNKSQLNVPVGEVGGIAGDALRFDGQTYNASLRGQVTRISGVAARISGNDAVNLDQVSTLSAAFGGGINWAKGAFTNPAYNMAGGSFGTVGNALAARSGKLTSLETNVSTITTVVASTVRYDNSSRDAVTLEEGDGSRIANLKGGVDGTNVPSINQVRQGVAESRAYTDTKAVTSLRDSKAYADSRIAEVWQGIDDWDARVNRNLAQHDKRIDRLAAIPRRWCRRPSTQEAPVDPKGVLVQLSAGPAGKGPCPWTGRNR